METRTKRWLTAAVALVLLAGPATAVIPLSILIDTAINGGKLAKLLEEAKKRHDQLVDTIEEVEKYQERAAGVISEVGRMPQQLGGQWRKMYSATTAPLHTTLQLPGDLQASAGGLVDTLSGVTGAATPADGWRAYTGPSADPAPLITRLGRTATSPTAGVLQASQAYSQRREALAIATRAAAADASTAAARAKQVADAQKGRPMLERASETALLQRMIAAQLTTNDLLQVLVQSQALAAAAATAPVEEEVRRRNEALRLLQAELDKWEAERARQAALSAPDDFEVSTGDLYSLDWARTP